MSIGEYGKLSVERKKMQAEGVMPEVVFYWWVAVV